MTTGKGKMIKQKGFSRKVESVLKKHRNEKLRTLDEDDIDQFITVFWEEVSSLMKQNVRVIFEGWISFFVKPVKRNCYDKHKNIRWNTFKRRVRMKVLPLFREHAETEISEEDYIDWKEVKK